VIFLALLFQTQVLAAEQMTPEHREIQRDIQEAVRASQDRNAELLETLKDIQAGQREITPALHVVGSELKALNENLAKQNDWLGKLAEYFFYVMGGGGLGLWGLRQTKVGVVLGDRRLKPREEP
jgi:septal ring factor EnvC (AmiA/AmiB activator)